MFFSIQSEKILTDPTVSIDHFLLNLQLPAQPETLYGAHSLISSKAAGKRVRPKMVLTSCGLLQWKQRADALHARRRCRDVAYVYPAP